LIKNPCDGIRRIKIPERQPIFYSKKEFRKLLEVIDQEDIRDLVIFAVNTGLRSMELIKLQLNQINFNERLVTLDNRNHITKSKRIRTIPLNDMALEIIQKRKPNIKQVIFTMNGKEYKQDVLSKTFKKYVRKAKLNDKLNFHSLRHTFASWLVQAGVDIFRIQRLLGHADISTTQIYVHLRRDDLKSSVNCITI